ncbi:MAG TPA: hypothetical protein VLC46_09640 [Thermoanaerobaculia bacterium]|nr:hypothetical protein [Thermoanaerobaculia bacterium]
MALSALIYAICGWPSPSSEVMLAGVVPETLDGGLALSDPVSPAIPASAEAVMRESARNSRPRMG